MSQASSRRNVRLAIAIVALVILGPLVVAVATVIAIRSDAGDPPPPGLPAQIGLREGSSLAGAAASGPTATEPPPPDHPGAAAYAVCAACHGGEAEGNPMLGGPALAGQERWYLERQLAKFKAGVRGSHEDDIYGQQMAPMAQTLADEQAIAQVADYIARFPPVAEPEANDGDPVKGQALYALCSACHGPEARGVEAQGGPSLRHQHAWYLERQIAHFKAGIRGSHPQDSHGQLMRPMAMTLADETAIRDVVAYIISLQSGG